MQSIKNLVESVKSNKNVIIKKSLIVVGTAAGLILTAGLLKKTGDKLAVAYLLNGEDAEENKDSEK